MDTWNSMHILCTGRTCKFSKCNYFGSSWEECCQSETSCSSHHAEYSKREMRDPCSVCGSFKFRQPNHTPLNFKNDQVLQENQVLGYIRLNQYLIYFSKNQPIYFNLHQVFVWLFKFSCIIVPFVCVCVFFHGSSAGGFDNLERNGTIYLMDLQDLFSILNHKLTQEKVCSLL